MVAKTPRFAAAIACLVAGSDAFSPSLTGNSVAVNSFRHQAVGPLFVVGAGDGPKDGTTLTSARKEIAYDAASGRFFETDLDPEDCVPDDEYCVVDKDSGELVRLTLEEKERIFLDSLQSYYVSGRQLLNDAEFDLLKEDLAWNGSTMVNMNRQETKYLAAVQAYLKGKPMLPDAEFDQLKKDLKEEGSAFASSKDPKCYIDTGICTVTYQPDNFRNNLLYLPVGAVLSIFWLGFGFEVIEPIIRLNPLILAALGAPLIYNGSITLTDKFIFPNNQIVYGPCPACETETRVFFGNILGVEGFGDVAGVKCTKCKAAIQVQRKTLRASTLPKND
eukprot:CAMPEP_0201882058 /NCGR_PEP_ID=MMETSP0902-20130614/13061_1 /ASSEMBLY_ACC=CAM_ASM_000551 /TAXON_ID=420261 /ORGANISM="Thalassiosira antarctica, Strain CCMP982" /LENGTH=332 /DNA_ID=CAMNT_0048410431 /DNA_START=50 /DNA_END=1048 /DNA_ORIENTATION=+